MPENIGIHISSIYEYLHFICVGTILITLFALQSNVTTGHVGIFQQSCIDHIHEYTIKNGICLSGKARK